MAGRDRFLAIRFVPRPHTLFILEGRNTLLDWRGIYGARSPLIATRVCAVEGAAC
jgi:hypothetical protein